jgi:galactoside O-acetyltransferase
MLNALLKPLVRMSTRVEVGKNSQVNWWGLRSCGKNHMRVGSESIVRCRVHFDSGSGRITIGDRCFLGASHLVCHSEITIGDDVIISWGVTIVDHDSHSIIWDHRSRDVRDWMRGEKDWSHVSIAPVIIGDKVWIGFGATVLKGVKVGAGAVIGAGAVVTKDVPEYTVVAGNPARVVRRIIETSN